MISRHPCSDTPRSARPQDRLVVLEGMPGAGKTTTACALRRRGLCVLGEYTDDTDETVAVGSHPAVAADDAHQHNWLRKTAQCSVRLSHGSTVYVDRDWLSSLSYAYSIACADSGALLRQRCIWTASRLRDGGLLLPSVYVMFDIDPRTSLRRRSGRLRPGHPWNRPDALRRLREFYTSLSDVLFPIHPGLAMALRLPVRLAVSGRDDQGKILHCLSALGSQT